MHHIGFRLSGPPGPMRSFRRSLALHLVHHVYLKSSSHASSSTTNVWVLVL